MFLAGNYDRRLTVCNGAAHELADALAQKHVICIKLNHMRFFSAISFKDAIRYIRPFVRARLLFISLPFSVWQINRACRGKRVRRRRYWSSAASIEQAFFYQTVAPRYCGSNPTTFVRYETMRALITPCIAGAMGDTWA